MKLDILTKDQESRNFIFQCVFDALEEWKSKEFQKEYASITHNKTEVAKIIGRSPKTVTKLIKDGTLKSTSDGCKVTRKALDEYLGNH